MLPQVTQTVRLARRIAKGIARRLDALARRLDAVEKRVSRVAPAIERSSHDEAVMRVMSEYNMVTHPDEPYYAEQYLHFILPELERRFRDRRTTILDLGCGQGRLSLPVARWSAGGGGTVTGVDLTAGAVAQARQYAAAQGLRNVTFLERDALEFVREAADASADAVLFTEVTFFLPSYREVLKELGRLLRPGGVAFIAFRSQYYNLLQLVWFRSWENAKRCLAEREGHIFGEPVWFGWQTVEDVHRLVVEVGLRVLRLFGIGVFSGIVEDARGGIVHPALLSAEDQKAMMELECAAAEQYAACGRYILTVAEKPLHASARVSTYTSLSGSMR